MLEYNPEKSDRFTLKLVIYLYSNITKQQQEHFLKVSVVRITTYEYTVYSGKIYIYKVQFFFIGVYNKDHIFQTLLCAPCPIRSGALKLVSI